MPKLTKEQWSKLTREQQQEALLRFEEPQDIWERPVNYKYFLRKESV